MNFAGPSQDADNEPTLLCKGAVWIAGPKQEWLYLIAKSEIGQ
jgi:hypothetical protein